MSLWKKAVGTAATATLLASLLLTTVATSVFAFTAPCDATFPNGPYGTAIQYCTNVTSRPADGVSFIDLHFTAATSHAVTSITVTGGTFIGGTGTFAGKTGATVTLVPGTIAAPVAGPPASSDLYLASTTAGTATVTVTFSDGTATTDSITSFTFTAAAATTVSTAYSTTTLSAKSAPAVGGTTGITATTLVRDTNNVAIAAGASVTWTLSGPAYFVGTGTVTQTLNADATGTAVSSAIASTGVPGAVTVATTVKYLGVSYTLTAKTLNLVGPVSKIVLSNNVFSIPVDNSNDDADGTFGDTNGVELEAAVTDASGQPIASGVTFTLGAYTPANIFTVDIASATYDTTDKAYDFNVDCVDTGSATVTLKAATTLNGTTTTVTSDPITFVCADPLASDAVGTLDISASAASVAPNGSVNILVTVKDDNGLAAPDGTPVTAVTNGVGNVVSSKGVLNSAKTSNGTAKFIYLAPANAGSATVTAFVSNASPSSKAVTITIGGAAPSGPITWAPTTSALGNTMTGPFTFATKIQSIGGYITWKVDGGAALAGQTIQVWVYKKYSATGAWSAATMLTTRKANASGVAYLNIHTGGVLWLSLRPVLPATATTAASWGPTSIGRWR